MDESAFGGSTTPGTMAGGNTDFGGGLSMDAGPSPAADQASGPAPPTAPSFGAGLSFGQPRYTTPDPSASPLDQSADLLQQRITRANQIATNPIAQFFNPEGVQAARDFVPKAAEALQTIRQQKAAIAAGKQISETLGLAPGEVPDEATREQRVEFAKNAALKGDMRKFQGLQAEDPKAAESIQDQVHEAVAGHLTKAQFAYDSLAMVQNPGQYDAKVRELRASGALGDLESLGLKVPPSFDAFNATKAQEGLALRQARIGVDTIRQKLEDRNTYQPMEKKEAETYNGRLTTAYGDQITNGTWSRNGAAGTRGLVVNGAADPRDLGKTFTLATADQRKAIKEEFDGAVPKEDIEKYRAFNRTYQMATTDAKGNPMAADKINTNPNVQQGVAEGLASMLRGGQGGANVGLLKIELAKRGWAQGTIDNFVSNYAGAMNTLFANADKPYLSQTTQKQIRDVMDVLKTYNDSNVSDRVSQIAQRAGALGLDPAALGFGKNESVGVISDAIKAGKDAQVARMMPNHQAIGGGDGVLQLGAQRPGVGATGTPPSTATTTQLPGAQPLQTPVQQSASPSPAPGGGAPPAAPNQPAPSLPPGGSGPAGGGTPITIAGQQISVPLPAGASPDFVSRLQRIESGNEKNPWTAGTAKSSASGAFQFINATWAENKPAGAPARAADATPAQQAQALATLTTKNATQLTNAGVPVNDTNLYIAHNVGPVRAAQLLHADPTADARSVVGEAAAANNPLFFKGRPTIATVLQRYVAEMNPVSTAATKAEPTTLPDVGAAPWTGRTTPAGDHIATPEERANSPVVRFAPALGSTAGAVGGSLAGPGGAIAGGAAGGGAGQAFKDWMQGRPQDPAKIAEEAALGGVLGVAPAGRPILGALARVAGVGGVEAGAEAARGGSTEDVTEAALKGGAYALGGEALGRFVSSAGATAYKALSRYTTAAQSELSAQAGKLAEARKVLETEQPKLPGEGAGANPKYEVAKKAADDATNAIKDHGQNPDDMVHAYEQAKSGVSAGEAATMRGAAAEKRDVSAGYNELRQQVGETGVGAVKPAAKLPDGPVSMLRTAGNPTGKVPEQFRAEAEHAELLATAPAKNWGEKWQQLQNAGTELIQKRISFLANNDKPSADAMNALFEGVRAQQKAAANYVFGPERGAKIIANLETLDTRYAKVMNATQGMDYAKMQSVLAQGNTPARRDLEKNFTEFAKGDPSAIRAFNAMKAGARGDWKSEASLMAPVIAGEVAANLHGIPTVGAISALVGGHRLYKMVQGYMNARVLGKAVVFKDFLANELKTSLPNVAATQRGAVMQQ